MHVKSFRAKPKRVLTLKIKIMAPAYMTSSFSTRKSYKSSPAYMDLFQVTVEDFDGESFIFEVSAESYEEAAAQAEIMAADQGCYNILNMFIYSL